MDTVVRYEPRGAARELFRAKDSELVISGPAGTGKSLACLYRMHLVCMLNPGIRCLITRKTAVSLSATTLVTFRKKVAAEALLSGVVRWYGGSSQEAAGYKYSNGSEIDVIGMDRPEKILSSEYDLVFVDEVTELTITDWETIGTRLRNGKLSWQQQMGACNPVYPSHWIKLRKMKLLVSKHLDNPAYYREDGSLTDQGASYMSKLDNLTGVRRLRLRDGIWATAEGVIYEDFNEDVHVIDRFEIPQSWDRYWSVDFGYTHPFVLGCWAEDPDGRLYLYREIYKTKTLVEDHAKKILSLVTDTKGNWTEPKPRKIVCDHDAEDRATLERHLGMPTVAANKKVSEGLQAVQSRFRVQPDGKPRIFFFRDALVERDSLLVEASKPLCLIDEIPGYVWDDRNADNPREAPLKNEDDSADQMRYVVAEKDLGLTPRYRSFKY